MPTDPIEDLEVTSVDEWRKPPPVDDPGFKVKLPSGRVIRMRRTMDLVPMLKEGRIPNPLAQIVKGMIDGKPQRVDPEKIGEAGIVKMLDFIEAGVLAAVIEPSLVKAPDLPEGEEWTPPRGKLAVHEIPFEDQMFIYSVAQGGATELAKFRKQQEDTMALVSDGKAVPPAPKRPARAGKKR